MRYCKQKDRFSCGPIAILNAIKWSGGIGVTYNKYIKRLMESCNCTSGTNHSNFDRAIRVAGKDAFKVRRVYYPKLGEIERHLKNNGAIVISYSWKRGRHLCLLIGVEQGNFIIVNGDMEGAAVQSIPREIFKRIELRYQRVDPHYKGWFLNAI